MAVEFKLPYREIVLSVTGRFASMEKPITLGDVMGLAFDGWDQPEAFLRLVARVVKIDGDRISLEDLEELDVRELNEIAKLIAKELKLPR